MNKSIILSIAALALIFEACNNSSNSKEQSTSQAFDTTNLITSDLYYQCEMDTEVISNKPGACPKCGMDLMKVEKR